MRALRRVLVMMVGFWLVYRGHVRQQALAGMVDGALATPGQVVGGGGGTPHQLLPGRRAARCQRGLPAEPRENLGAVLTEFASA